MYTEEHEAMLIWLKENLAIMAKKLGSKTITAIDNGDWSIINAKENFHPNRCKEISLIKKICLMIQAYLI